MPAKKDKKSVPRYENFRPRTLAASRVGVGNRRQNTTPEMLLRKALWRRGLRYRLHAAKLPGRPDIVLPRYRLVVFCDGDFWHGRDWPKRKRKLAKGWNAKYWVAKIARNRVRDRIVNKAFRTIGWQVIRIWESDVRHDADRVATKIAKFIETPETKPSTLRKILRSDPSRVTAVEAKMSFDLEHDQDGHNWLWQHIEHSEDFSLLASRGHDYETDHYKNGEFVKIVKQLLRAAPHIR